MVGGYIFRADNGHGESYEVFEDRLEKVDFHTNNERLFKMFQETFIKEKKIILPLSEKDFETLAQTIVVNAGKANIDEIIKVSASIFKI